MSLCYRYERLHNEVRICLVGKYTSLEDAYTSVIKALRHAAVYCNYKVDIQVCYQRVSFLVLPKIKSDQAISISIVMPQYMVNLVGVFLGFKSNSVFFISQAYSDNYYSMISTCSLELASRRSKKLSHY